MAVVAGRLSIVGAMLQNRCFFWYNKLMENTLKIKKIKLLER